MSRFLVRSFAISIDGYGAGPDQDLQNPLGVRGPELMEWFFHTRVWRTIHGHAGGEAGVDSGETGVDNGMAEQGFAGIGAWILGRNMFGPIRGPWPDTQWKGWWGEEPPYHTPVFVLTHHPRARSRWREARNFASSPTVFMRLWSRPQPRRAAVTSASAAASPLSGSIFAAA